MTAFLINPKAGGGKAASLFARLVSGEKLAELGKVHICESLDALPVLVNRFLDEGTRRLVVVGGDGTFHHVINVIYRLRALDALTLGLVPAGTGSDLARSLALPRQRRLALAQALEAAPKPMDLGLLQCGDEELIFCNVASFGISGLVDARVNANPQRGATAFLKATLLAFREFQPIAARVLVDDQELYAGPLLLAAVASGQYFGKGMRIAPNARLADGLLEVVAVEATPTARLVLRLPLLYLGRHLTLPQVHSARGQAVRLEVSGQVPPFDVDGECYPAGPAIFRVLPGACQVAYGDPSVGVPAQGFACLRSASKVFSSPKACFSLTEFKAFSALVKSFSARERSRRL